MRIRQLFGLLLVLGSMLTIPARADDAALTPTDRTAIHTVIADQLAAFQRDDGVAAFAQAAPVIRERFVTPENFLAMVRAGYAPVYRPREVAFGTLETVEGRLVQRVLLVGPDGLPAVALYVMERQPDGTWKIAACILTVADDKAT